MRNTFRLPATLAVVIFLSACNRSTVSLDYTNAREEVPPLGNLVFRFSQPLVKESLLDRWDSTDYVDFEPKIPGRFRWEHPDELVFSPAAPLAPATDYKATLNKLLLQYSKFGGIGKGSELAFHTPGLKLENSNTTWVLKDENSNIALPQIDLRFNYPVSPAGLKDRLKIEVDGQPVSFNLQTLSADDRISVRLLNLKMEDKDYDASITIDKGLVPEGGVKGTQVVTEFKTSIPSPFVLSINDVSADQDGVGGTVRVSTSQQVAPASVASYISIDPAVKFTVETTENGFAIRSDNFDQTKSYALTISKGLRGRIGGTLHEEYKSSVAAI